MLPDNYDSLSIEEKAAVEGAHSVNRAEDGTILSVGAPAETPHGELHPSQVEGYEPHFDRIGITRRVLGHVTDEVDVTDLGPRNTITALAYAISADPFTPLGGSPIDVAADLRDHLDKLVAAGLLMRRSDGSFEVTDAGLVELRN